MLIKKNKNINDNKSMKYRGIYYKLDTESFAPVSANTKQMSIQKNVNSTSRI